MSDDDTNSDPVDSEHPDPHSGEVHQRYTAEDGTVGGERSDDTDKMRYDLIPPWPYYLLAQVYTIGAKKYSDNNWTKGMSWMRMIGSMKRHMEAFIMGDSLDQEGFHHMAAVAWGAFALMEFEMNRKEFDDRPANVLAVARELYEKASVRAPMTDGKPVVDLTDEDRATIDKARALLADKAVAAGQYLTREGEEAPGHPIDPEAERGAYAPPADMVEELATRPQVMDDMREQDDLTEDERDLLRAAESQAATQPAEDPDVREDRVQERAKRLAQKAKDAPGLGTVRGNQSIGTTRFQDAQAKSRGR